MNRVIEKRRQVKEEEKRNILRGNKSGDVESYPLIQSQANIATSPSHGATFLTGAPEPTRKMSEIGFRNTVHLMSPQSHTMSHGFFNESHLRQWASTRKSMVTGRYERELELRIAETERAKKWEKIAKSHKKHVQDSVQHKVRELQNERLTRIAEDRRKEDLKNYFESKHNN